jgi:thiaminase
VVFKKAESRKLIKYAYTRHEFTNAYSGNLFELIAGLFPCIVGWQILSKRLDGNTFGFL